MELKKFNEMLASIEAEQRTIFNKALEMKANGVLSLYEYAQIGAVKQIWWKGEGFVRKVEVMSKSIRDLDIDDLIKTVAKFKNDYKKIKEIGKSAIENDEDAGDGYILFVGYKYHYYVLDTEVLEREIMRLIREKIKDQLKPESVKYAITPDYKIVQLFRDGVIDWATLQRITYKDCQI